MDYKQAILRTLEELEKLDSGGGGTKALIKKAKYTAERETSSHRLFLMHQTLREVLDQEKGGKGEAPFLVRMPSGEKREFKNLKHLEEEMGGDLKGGGPAKATVEMKVPKDKRARREI